MQNGIEDMWLGEIFEDKCVTNFFNRFTAKVNEFYYYYLVNELIFFLR